MHIASFLFLPKSISRRYIYIHTPTISLTPDEEYQLVWRVNIGRIWPRPKQSVNVIRTSSYFRMYLQILKDYFKWRTSFPSQNKNQDLTKTTPTPVCLCPETEAISNHQASSCLRAFTCAIFSTWDILFAESPIAHPLLPVSLCSNAPFNKVFPAFLIYKYNTSHPLPCASSSCALTWALHVWIIHWSIYYILQASTECKLRVGRASCMSYSLLYAGTYNSAWHLLGTG